MKGNTQSCSETFMRGDLALPSKGPMWRKTWPSFGETQCMCTCVCIHVKCVVGEYSVLKRPQRQHNASRSRAETGERCMGNVGLIPISLGGQGKSDHIVVH